MTGNTNYLYPGTEWIPLNITSTSKQHPHNLTSDPRNTLMNNPSKKENNTTAK